MSWQQAVSTREGSALGILVHGLLALSLLVLLPSWSRGEDQWLGESIERLPVVSEVSPLLPSEPPQVGLEVDSQVGPEVDSSGQLRGLVEDSGWPGRGPLVVPRSEFFVSEPEPELAGDDPVQGPIIEPPADYFAPALAPPAGAFVERPDLAGRFGWWATKTNGDLVKVGEYQDLQSGPFFDVDGLSSNYWQTLDFTLTALDQEDHQARVYYFGPHLSADFEYERFPHRLDHDPLDNFRDPPSDGRYVSVDDQNIGEDYAIRVQELKADFQGKLPKNFKWRLKVWGMRKHGERQAEAMAHCFHPGDFSSFRCHTVSQRQEIDWLTMEIEPAVSGRIGPVSVEYSRTMRAFNQNDQGVTRDYDTAIIGFVPGADLPYAVVPEYLTQIDRVQFSADLPARSRFYANLFYGDMENESRNIHRIFRGFDLRLTRRSFDGLQVTGFAKVYDQENEKPSTLLDDPGETSLANIREPVDRTWTKAGVKGRWRLFSRRVSSEGLWLNGGYEYRYLDRENVDYTAPAGTFVQPDTISNLMHAGLSMRWSSRLNTYVRYKMGLHDYPLFGFDLKNNVSLESALNSGLPEEEHLVEIGGTWMPVPKFLLSTKFGIENRYHSSEYAWFDGNGTPIVASLAYAPTHRWSLSAGYARTSNLIDQEITLGDTQPFSSEWHYVGESDVWNVGARYDWSKQVVLRGDVIFTRGRNGFDTPPSPAAGVDYSDLPPLSDVVVETTRINVGVDYHPWLRDWNCYFRYNYFNYDDESVDFNSGAAHMFLLGFMGLR